MKAWDSKGYWLKAKYFIDKTGTLDPKDREFAFWATLSLECLARAALTKVHPALNADPRQDTNVLAAFGFNVTAEPKSLPAHSVFLRLEKIVPHFTKTQRELCEFVSILRNQHVHSAEMPYENLNPKKWLPRYYEVTSTLNGFLGKSLDDFFGAPHAKLANAHIKSLKAEVEAHVKTKISKARGEFKENTAAGAKVKKDPTRELRLLLAPESAKRTCPACKNEGMIEGDLIAESEAVYEDEELTTTMTFLASNFQCSTCSMVLKGIDEILIAGLDPHFTKVRSTSLHELYQPDYDVEYDNM